MKKTEIVREGNARHLKYFCGDDKLRSTGAILMATSGILFLWNWFIWFFTVFYFLMFLLFPVGLVLFIVGSIGRTADEDIDKIIATLSAQADVDREKDAALLRRLRQRPLPQTLTGYDYSDGLMFRKTKNNVVRSEIYHKATLLPLEDALCILYAKVNIPCETVEKGMLELPYEDIEDMRVVSERRTIRFSKRSFSVLDSRLEIFSNGKMLLSLPAKENAALDEFVEELKVRKTK